MSDRLPNPHPGKILLEEFLEPLSVSAHRLALEIGVPPNRINDIVRGKRSITADTALRLGRCLNTTPEFWLGLQNLFDLEATEARLGTALNRIDPLIADNTADGPVAA